MKLSIDARELLSAMVCAAEWMKIHAIQRVYLYCAAGIWDWTVVAHDAGPDRIIFAGWSD